MGNYLIGLAVLIFANYFLIVVKGKDVLNKYLFFPFFTIAYFAFALNFYDIYQDITKSGIVMIYINVIFIIILLYLMLLTDQKWKKPRLKELDTNKLIKITKLISILNLFITIYFLITLSNKSGISIIDLYLKHPYFLELNFVSNAILGNLLKTNLFNLVLMAGLKLKGVEYKNYTFYLVLVILTLLAPNRKGEIVLAILAYTHLIFLYKKLNFSKLIKLFSYLFGGIILVFVITYSFYKTAGVKISIFNKIYTYLTYPIAGSAFLQKEKINSVFELQTFSSIFNKMNILEAKGIAVHNSVHFVGGNEIGNVGGIFSPLYSDFGFLGPIFFILIIVAIINLLELFRKNNIAETLFVIFISFLDLALFGNYFLNPLFIEMLASFFVFYILYRLRIPSITIR